MIVDDPRPFALPDDQQPSDTAGPPAFLSPPPRKDFPEDIRTPWGWRELILFVLVILIGIFLLSYALLAVFYLHGVSPATLRSSTDAKTVFVVINQTLLSLGLLIYLYARNRSLFRLPFWRTIGWRRFRSEKMSGRLAYATSLATGAAFAIFVEFLSSLAGKPPKLPIEIFFQDRRSAILLLLASVLIAPLVEETIFRGYIYPVLARSLGIAGGVFVTGTIFGLLHAPQLWGGWAQVGLLVLVGIVFTYARAASRTVFVSYFLHLGYNGLLFAAYAVSTGGFRHLPLGR